MGFSIKAATRFAASLLLAMTIVSSVTATPGTTHSESPVEDDLDVGNYKHHGRLQHFTQEEYLALNGGIDPTHTIDEETPTELKRRQTTYTPVTGALQGGCSHRRKLEELQSTDPAAFNLFMLAIENIQKINERNEMSWYGIMGIHGLPYIPWGQPLEGNYLRDRGYCPHASAIFSTWHRPFLLLMEQWIQEKARRISLQFNGTARDTYTAAAPRVRLPYWDWSSPVTQSNIPPVVRQSTVTLIKPNPGFTNPVTVSVPNPLFQYTFKDQTLKNTWFDGNFLTWSSTRRQPDSSGTSNNNLANSIMQNGYSGRRSSTYYALGRPTYSDFNNEIEGIHNGVHVNTGGNGHMSWLGYSAFDPIFFLHHCNVDRMFAMWQASRPGVYLQTSPATPNFGRNIDPATCGCSDNLGTALFPFHLSNGQWWKSDHIKDARNIWQYGYGYDEVPCSYQGRPTTDLTTFTNGRINALYGPTQATGMRTDSVTASGDSAPKKRTEFSLRMACDNAAIPSTWTMTCFLGPVPPSSSDWLGHPTMVGTVSALGTLKDSGSMKVSKAFWKDMQLTEPALAAGLIKPEDYNEKAVTDILTNLLNCALSSNGEPLNMASVRTFKYGVYSIEVTYPARNNPGEMPVYGKANFLPKITENKPAGIKGEKDMDTCTLLDGSVVPLPPPGA